MANKIKFQISKHPLTGVNRVIEFEGIQFLFYSHSSAELVWFEYPSDENGDPIKDEIITPRRIITPISNENRVTEQGIMITKEYVKSTLPEDTKEEDLEKTYRELFEKGIPEFDFWMGVVGWDNLIIQAGQMLEQFKRFDRK